MHSFHYDTLNIITVDYIQPIHPLCVFLLLNTAKHSTLLQLFHEIQPYGFNINGKYDCGPSALSRPSLPHFLL